MFGMSKLFLATPKVLKDSKAPCRVLNVIRKYAANPKRFYKNTSILYSNGRYEITLDTKKLKTPKAKEFTVENEALALAVAAEWDSQTNEIERSSMHLTGLCNTAIDNVNNLTSSEIVDKLLAFLETDTLLFHSHNDDVYNLQQKEWQPAIDWFCERYSVEIQPTRDIVGPDIAAITKETIQRHLLSYNLTALHGFMFAVEALKSVILALCCVDRRLTVAQAVLLSRLEEEYQANSWGRVEWAHDLSQHDLQARVAAALLFIHLNSMSDETKSKLASIRQ